MKKALFLIAILALVAITPSCVNDDTDFSKIIADNDSVTIRTIEIDDSPVIDSAEIIPTSEGDIYYDDYIENQSLERVVNIALSDADAAISGDQSRCTITHDGAHVKVYISGKKVLLKVTGSTANGSITIYGDNKFGIMLCGAQIHNPHGSAINSQNKKRMYVVLQDGSVNKLSDGTDYHDTEGEAQKGTLFSEGKIIISGSGMLRVEGNARNGIATDDYLRIRPGVHTHITTSVGHGIKTNDGVLIDGGVHNIVTSGNGARGIRSESLVTVRSGRTTIITSGASIIEDADTTSAACIKADSTLVVSGGTLRLKSTGEGGKGINVAGNYTQTSGSVTVVTLGENGLSSAKGVKTDKQLHISGGNFYSYSVKSYAVDGIIVPYKGHKKLLKAKRYYIVEF